MSDTKGTEAALSRLRDLSDGSDTVYGLSPNDCELDGVWCQVWDVVDVFKHSMYCEYEEIVLGRGKTPSESIDNAIKRLKELELTK